MILKFPLDMYKPMPIKKENLDLFIWGRAIFNRPLGLCIVIDTYIRHERSYFERFYSCSRFKIFVAYFKFSFFFFIGIVFVYLEQKKTQKFFIIYKGKNKNFLKLTNSASRYVSRVWGRFLKKICVIKSP